MDAISIPETKESQEIQWKQLWSLVSLYASVIIGWIAYENYQPKLLVQFRFTDFTFSLAVAQAIILVLTPPIAGFLGDRFRTRKGHRLPVVSSGISFAAMIFMAVAFTLFITPGEIFKWILPVLIVCWLIAMSIFTSPALSTVELFTPAERLPKAMALLTIASNLIYAIEPVIVDVIDYLGAPLTFVSGGVVTFISGYAMKKNSRELFKQRGNKEEVSQQGNTIMPSRKSAYGFIFFLGIVLGIATTVMFNLFPEALSEKLSVLLNNTDGKFILVGMLFFSALISWPISNLVNRYSMNQVFMISCGLIALCIVGIFFLQSAWMVMIMVIVFIIAFTALSVSTLPLAISRSGHFEKVFCVGVFFSGVALPEGIVESMMAF